MACSSTERTITLRPTVHTTLPVRSASQGVSFAFLKYKHSIDSGQLGVFFNSYFY